MCVIVRRGSTIEGREVVAEKKLVHEGVTAPANCCRVLGHRAVVRNTEEGGWSLVGHTRTGGRGTDVIG